MDLSNEENPLNILENAHPILKRFSNHHFKLKTYLNEVVSNNDSRGLNKKLDSLKKYKTMINEEMGQFFYQFYVRFIEVDKHISNVDIKNRKIQDLIEQYECSMVSLEKQILAQINSKKGEIEIMKEEEMGRFDLQSYLNPPLGSKRWFEEFPEKIQILISDGKFEECLLAFKELKETNIRSRNLPAQLIQESELAYSKLINSLCKEIMMNPNNLMAIRCLRTMNFTKRAISAYLQGKSKIIKIKLRKLNLLKEKSKRAEDLCDIFINYVLETKKDYSKYFGPQKENAMPEEKIAFTYLSHWILLEIDNFMICLDSPLNKNESLSDLKYFTRSLINKFYLFEKNGICQSTELQERIVITYKRKLGEWIDENMNESVAALLDIRNLYLQAFSLQDSIGTLDSTSSLFTRINKYFLSPLFLCKHTVEFLTQILISSLDFVFNFLNYASYPMISLSLAQYYIHVITPKILTYFKSLLDIEHIMGNPQGHLVLICNFLSSKKYLLGFQEMINNLTERELILTGLTKDLFKRGIEEAIEGCQVQIQKLTYKKIIPDCVHRLAADAIFIYEKKLESLSELPNPSESFIKIGNKITMIYQNIFQMTQDEDFSLLVSEQIAFEIISSIEKAVNGDYELFSNKEKTILKDETQLNIYDLSSYGIINLIFGIYHIAYGFTTTLEQFAIISKDLKYEENIQLNINSIVDAYVKKHSISKSRILFPKAEYIQRIKGPLQAKDNPFN